MYSDNNKKIEDFIFFCCLLVDSRVRESLFLFAYLKQKIISTIIFVIFVVVVVETSHQRLQLRNFKVNISQITFNLISQEMRSFWSLLVKLNIFLTQL